MAIWQGESQRKSSGGRRHPHAKKRKFEIGREPVLTTLGATKRKQVRIRAGETRVRVLVAKQASVTDPKTGKTQLAEIKTVSGNPANIHYVRRNIVTKGAILETSLGRARVTSRPGQDGTINAVKVE
ncbi:MAG: 30S ribosomal protein S8e [Thermoplasmatota archaeon]